MNFINLNKANDFESNNVFIFKIGEIVKDWIFKIKIGRLPEWMSCHNSISMLILIQHYLDTLSIPDSYHHLQQ